MNKKSLILERGAVCLACGRTDRLCLDHIKPKKLGGSDDLINLQVLCTLCNTSKGRQTIDFKDGVPDWFKKRRELGCTECGSKQTYVRQSTQERVCRSCGAILPLKTKPKEA